MHAGALLVIALAGGATAPARGPDVVGNVSLEAPACPIAPVAWPDFVQALRVELAGRPPSEARLVALAVEPCDVGTTNVRVSLDGGTSRDVELADVAPPARARALALAVAELVPAAPPSTPPSVAPPVVVAPPPSNPPPPPLERHPRETAAVVGRVFPQRSTVQLGARLTLGARSSVAFSELFVEALAGGRSVADGDVVVRSFGGGAAFGAHARAGGVDLAAGVALGLDWTRIAGASPAPGVSAHAGAGLTITPGLRLVAALPVGAAWSVELFAEPGYVVRHLDAEVDGAPAAGARGPAISFGLGVAHGRP